MLLSSRPILAFWRRNDKPLRAREKISSTEAIVTPTPLESCSHRQISPQVASALLCKLRTQMSETQRQTVDALKSNCPGFTTMRSLVMGFRTILRTGTIKSLHIWMKRAQSSGIYGMQRFVRRLRQDLSAVEAAVSETWSNGPVEGHVGRLKTIKHQMYGRAGFALLSRKSSALHYPHARAPKVRENLLPTGLESRLRACPTA
jgi:transposase